MVALICRIKDLVEAEIRRRFPNVYDRRPTTMSQPSSRPSRSMETVINRVQRSFPSSSSSSSGPARRSGLERPAPYSTRYRHGGIKSQGRSFTKDIVLVASDDINVPRGPRRRLLHELGLVANFVEFNTAWKENKVIQVIEEAFKKVVDASQPIPRYFFIIIIL